MNETCVECFFACECGFFVVRRIEVVWPGKKKLPKPLYVRNHFLWNISFVQSFVVQSATYTHTQQTAHKLACTIHRSFDARTSLIKFVYFFSDFDSLSHYYTSMATDADAAVLLFFFSSASHAEFIWLMRLTRKGRPTRAPDQFHRFSQFLIRWHRAHTHTHVTLISLERQSRLRCQYLSKINKIFHLCVLIASITMVRGAVDVCAACAHHLHYVVEISLAV